MSKPFVPATTILPSDWMATAFAVSCVEPKSVVTRPSVSKLVSSVPLML
ncbi:MAG: hypothetical protein WBP93_21660 [Pyrinomonadaceae bacterium]